MLEQRMLFNASASLVKVDTTTSGSWSGTYGSDGYSVVGGTTQLPSYASLSVAGDQFYEWETPGTTDARAPQESAGSSTRVAAGDYSASSFTVNVDISDNQTHQVAIYVLDTDYRNRSETVSVADPSNNSQLAAPYDVKNFTGGEYLVYNVTGDVQFTISNDSGSLNAVMSGVFFDPGSGGSTGTGTGTGGGTTTIPAAASYVDTDSTTSGSWTTTYGQDGYSVVGGSTSLPAYATFATVGSTFYEWESPGTSDPNAAHDPRALTVTRSGNAQRVAAADYSDSGSFAVDLNVNGSAQVALYVLDEDYQVRPVNRSETIQISDASTDAVLSTQDVTNFTQGKYLVYDISGDVKITVINDPGSVNCVLSGIFFDDGKPATGGNNGGGGGSTPTTLTVGAGKEYQTIQSAVNAASTGDIIDVYSGTYPEQVVLPGNVPNLILESAKGQTVYVEPPTGGMTSTGAIIEDNGGNNDTIQGFNVMGPGTSTGSLRFGILIDGGATGVNVLNNNVSEIGDDNFSGFTAFETVPSASTGTPGDTGVGIALTDGSATIAGNIISSYQKAGILVGLTPTVTGSPTWMQSGVVENNVITGSGANTQVTQYGIEFVGLRATGSAQNNRVSGDQFTGPDTTGNAGGILVYNAGQVSVLSNIAYNSDTNIIIDGGQDSNGNPLNGSDFAIVSSNQVFNATYFDGIDLVDGVSKVTVNSNYVYNNDTDGIFIDANSGGNTIENNLVINNKNYDIEDVTYQASNYQSSPVYGTYNFYSQDQFGSSNDPSLPSSSYV